MKMNRNIHRVLSLLLAVVLCVGLFGGAVGAAGDIIASGTCGENLTWTLGDSGRLTISGSGDMPAWARNDVPWLTYSADIRSVSLPDGLTSIANYAFADCAQLTEIAIPDRVTSIGKMTFYNCGLREVAIPDSVTYIYDAAFYCCYSLTSVIIPDSVTYIGFKGFDVCFNLTDVFYSGTQEQWSAIRIGSGNDPLLSAQLHFPTLIASGLCGAKGGNLTWTLDSVGNLVISGTGAMADWFYQTAPWYAYNAEIRKVSLPDGLTHIGEYAFSYGYDNLTSVTIPAGVTSIGERAFQACQNLASITIPDSLSSIGPLAFSFCFSLTELTIPASVTDLAVRALSVPDNTRIHIDPDNPAYCVQGNAILSKDGKTLFQWLGNDSEYTIPDGVTVIGDYAFENYSSLTSITIPESVTDIGYCAFLYCNSLTDIYFTGTQAEWDAIAVADGNNKLLSATLHCAAPVPAAEFEACTVSSASVTVTNPGMKTVSAILVAYDAEGRLLGVSTVTVPAGAAAEDLTVSIDGLATAKLFLLDAADGTPVTDSLTAQP